MTKTKQRNSRTREKNSLKRSVLGNQRKLPQTLVQAVKDRERKTVIKTVPYMVDLLARTLGSLTRMPW